VARHQRDDLGATAGKKRSNHCVCDIIARLVQNLQLDKTSHFVSRRLLNRGLAALSRSFVKNPTLDGNLTLVSRVAAQLRQDRLEESSGAGACASQSATAQWKFMVG
jgi:hypothetical protein